MFSKIRTCVIISLDSNWTFIESTETEIIGKETISPKTDISISGSSGSLHDMKRVSEIVSSLSEVMKILT